MASILTRIWCEEAIRHLMTLVVSGQALNLGRHLPTLPCRPMFPDELQELRNEELLALLRHYDRTRNTTTGSGAANWSTLGYRMNYIVDLFRSQQQECSLHDQPPVTQ